MGHLNTGAVSGYGMVSERETPPTEEVQKAVDDAMNAAHKALHGVQNALDPEVKAFRAMRLVTTLYKLQNAAHTLATATSRDAGAE